MLSQMPTSRPRSCEFGLDLTSGLPVNRERSRSLPTGRFCCLDRRMGCRGFGGICSRQGGSACFATRGRSPGGDFLLSSRLGHAGIQRAIDIAAKLRPMIHQSLFVARLSERTTPAFEGRASRRCARVAAPYIQFRLSRRRGPLPFRSNNHLQKRSPEGEPTA
jgi:hypothetical protein